MELTQTGISSNSQKLFLGAESLLQNKPGDQGDKDIMHAVCGKGKIKIRPGKYEQPYTQRYHAEQETQPNPGLNQ
jgi:hypothetical protein